MRFRRSAPAHRLATLTALVLALALPAASAQAADPLLSGYAGPGGGAQVVLGATAVTPGAGASSPRSGGAAGAGSGSSAPAQGSGTPDLKADTSTTPDGGAGSALTRTPQHRKGSSTASKGDGHGAAPEATTTTATLPGAPQVVAYPTRAGDVRGLPVSATVLLLIVLGAAAATLLGLGLRRLSGPNRA